MEKVQWCERHLQPRFPIQITITEDKGLVDGAVLVDDHPGYVLRWLEFRPDGCVIPPDQPWNRDFQHPRVLRYAGDRDALAALLEEVAAAERARLADRDAICPPPPLTSPPEV